jgi:serine/threonine protein kinase
MTGADLGTLLAGGGGLEPGHALAIVGQLAAALGPEHARGFAHGAIEPANVELEGDRARLTGFGARPDAGAFTAPEVARGGEPSPRSDVYSLAALLCVTLTGAAPADGRPPSGLPEAVRAVLAGALAREPGARPADAGALMVSVRAALAGRGEAPARARRFFRRRRRRRR